jgi:redox-sensitive bicupin YhaK (pirin superfamily)
MGIGALRVINEDQVEPGAGFPTHPHRNMDIVSYVVEGALEHRDSMGTGSVLQAGEIQYMRAGSGVTHSEYNASTSDPVHFYQIWIVPDQVGGTPKYDQRRIDEAQREGSWLLLTSQSGEQNSIAIQRDLNPYTTRLSVGQEVRHRLIHGRAAWLQVVRGDVTVRGKKLSAGDAALLVDEAGIEVEARSAAELLLFDLQWPKESTS